jgi:hypothetical protein
MTNHWSIRMRRGRIIFLCTLTHGTVSSGKLGDENVLIL